MVKKPERRQFPAAANASLVVAAAVLHLSLSIISDYQSSIFPLMKRSVLATAQETQQKNPHGLSVNTGNLPPPHRRRYCVHSQSDLIWNRQQKMPIYCERDFISIVRYIETFTFPISLQKLFAVSGPGPSCSQLTLLWCWHCYYLILQKVRLPSHHLTCSVELLLKIFTSRRNVRLVRKYILHHKYNPSPGISY